MLFRHIDIYNLGLWVEMYGCTPVNSGELENIPKQCQFAVEVAHFTQVGRFYSSMLSEVFLCSNSFEG